MKASTYHEAGVEFIKPLDGPVAEAVAQVFLDKVGVVQDIVCYQGLLTRPSRRHATPLMSCRLWRAELPASQQIPCGLCAVAPQVRVLWGQ